jgi:hypothetical protein
MDMYRGFRHKLNDAQFCMTTKWDEYMAVWKWYFPKTVLLKGRAGGEEVGPTKWIWNLWEVTARNNVDIIAHFVSQQQYLYDHKILKLSIFTRNSSGNHKPLHLSNVALLLHSISSPAVTTHALRASLFSFHFSSKQCRLWESVLLIQPA